MIDAMVWFIEAGTGCQGALGEAKGQKLGLIRQGNMDS
jgi:hypothetical protein